MYAIVEIAGQQFKVAKDQEIFVHRLEGDKGTEVKFDNVLLLDQNGNVTVGSPGVSGAFIKAKIVEQLRGDKVIVFHKKRRKGYQKENGHRQYFSKVLIEDILTGEEKSTKTATVKKTKAKQEGSAESSEPKKTKAAQKVEKESSTVGDTQADLPIVETNIDITPENKTE